MTAIYETPIPLRRLPDPIAEAIARAESRGPFADANHIYGVLAEEMAEILDEVRSGDRGLLRAELLDLAGAALKAVKQIDRGD